MTKIKLIITLLLVTGSLVAQSLNNKHFLSVAVTKSEIIGSRELFFKNASFPKLFPNMTDAYGIKLGCTFLFNKHTGAGGIYNYNYLKDWDFKNKTDYVRTKIFISYFSPVIYVQTGDKLSRKFMIFSQAGPLISRIRVSLFDNIFYIEPNTGYPHTEILSTDQAGLGFHLSTGFYYSINETVNIELAGSYNYLKTKSVIYPDTRVNLLSVEAGVIYKIFKDKRYYY